MHFDVVTKKLNESIATFHTAAVFDFRRDPNSSNDSMCQIHEAMKTDVVHRTPLTPTEPLHTLRRPPLQTLQVPVYDPTTDQVFQGFSEDCSWAIEHVYFGGANVARDWDTIEKHGITHIVNCIKAKFKNKFENHIKYLNLHLQDSNHDDILSVLYDVFDFIEEAREVRGKVYVHCSQGISRSAALVIAYVMWRKKQSFIISKEEICRQRGIIEPNVVFCTQLIAAEDRLCQRKVEFCRIYRMKAQSIFGPDYLVPELILDSKQEENKDPIFDPRGTFIIHSPARIFLWIGKNSRNEYLNSARNFVQQLQKYEDAASVKEVKEGSEDAELLSSLRLLIDDTVVVHHRIESIEQVRFDEDYQLFNHTCLDLMTTHTN